MTIEQFDAAAKIQVKINRIMTFIDEINKPENSALGIYYPVSDEFKEKFKRDLNAELVNELTKFKNEFSKL